MRTRDLLLVEDNAAEARLIREALDHHAAGRAVRIRTAADAEQALAAVTAATPDLILLDLNLPGRGGHEVLEAIRRRPESAGVPVVVFSSSRDEDDIRRAYHGHANCYVAKPDGLDEYFRVLAGVEKFWFETVELP